MGTGGYKVSNELVKDDSYLNINGIFKESSI